MRTDKRVNATSEILNGIRVIKMYAWEDAFANLIDDLRRLSFLEVFFFLVDVFTLQFANNEGFFITSDLSI